MGELTVSMRWSFSQPFQSVMANSGIHINDCATGSYDQELDLMK
jgi:hypothetical protein